VDAIRRKRRGVQAGNRFNRIIVQQLLTLNRWLAKNNLYQLVELLQHPLRLLLLNFLTGLARGFGVALGVTLIAGAFLALLTRLASLNLPIIGHYIAEIVRFVNEQVPNIR